MNATDRMIHHLMDENERMRQAPMAPVPSKGTLQEEIEGQKETIGFQRRTIEGLKAQVERAEEAQESLHKHTVRVIETRNAAQKEVKEVKQANANLARERDAAKQAREILRVELSKTCEERNTSDRCAVRLKDENTRLKEERDGLAERLRVMTENHRRVAEEKRGVQEKLAGAQAEGTRLQKELEAKSAEREYWFTVAGERSTTIDVMEQDLHNLEEERDGARTARAAALKNLDEQRRERDAAQFKVKGLENEGEALRSKHHRVKLNNDDLRRTHARMEKEIEALRADREHWGEMAQERAAAMAQMDKELEETKEKLADEMEKVDGLKKEVDEAEMRSYENRSTEEYSV